MNTRVNSMQFHSFLTDGKTALSEAEYKVVEALSAEVIVHDNLREALGVVQNMLSENWVLSESRHVLMLGDAGCGKTTVLDIVRSQLPPVNTSFRLGNQRDQPLLAMSVPSPITVRSLAAHMLRALGDTSSMNGTCFKLTERLKEQIQRCKVKLIWLDEFQHLLALGHGTARGASRRLAEACNWIKAIINDVNVSFVLMGTMETMTLLDYDDQLERRFQHLCTLEAFAQPSTRSNTLIRFTDELLQKAVSVSVQFDSAEWFRERPIDAMRLWIASEGVPSRIKDLVIRACLVAMNRGSRIIAMVDFAHAFQQTRQKRLDFEVARARRRLRQKLVQAADFKSINPFAANDEIINQMATRMAA